VTQESNSKSACYISAATSFRGLVTELLELKHVVARDISPVTLTLVHSALQQRAASAGPLDQAARVCLLMHVGVAQAKSPL
jgi:hypothetical protein